MLDNSKIRSTVQYPKGKMKQTHRSESLQSISAASDRLMFQCFSPVSETKLKLYSYCTSENKVSALMHIVSFRLAESHEEGAASAAAVGDRERYGRVA